MLPTIAVPITIHFDGLAPAWLLVITVILNFLLVNRYVKLKPFWKSELELITLPGRVGGKLKGAYRIGKIFEENTFEAVLECNQTESDKDDSDSRPETKCLWFQTIEVLGHYHDSTLHTIVPVEFTIPLGLPSSLLPLQRQETRGEVTWLFKIKAKSKPDCVAVFDVPVFSKGTGTGKQRLSTSANSFEKSDKVPSKVEAAVKEDILTLLENDGFQVTQDLNGEVVFTVRRQGKDLRSAAKLLATIMLCVIGIFFTFIPYLWAAILASLIPAAILRVAVQSLVESYFWRAKIRKTTSRIEVDSGLGISKNTRCYPISAKTMITCHMISRTETSSYWNLQITGEAIRSVVLWRSLTATDAETIGSWIANELGVEFKKPNPLPTLKN